MLKSVLETSLQSPIRSFILSNSFNGEQNLVRIHWLNAYNTHRRRQNVYDEEDDYKDDKNENDHYEDDKNDYDHYEDDQNDYEDDKK